MVTISRFYCLLFYPSLKLNLVCFSLNWAFRYIWERNKKNRHHWNLWAMLNGKMEQQPTSRPAPLFCSFQQKSSIIMSDKKKSYLNKEMSWSPVRFEQLLLADTSRFHPGSSPDKPVTLSQTQGPCSVRSLERHSSFKIKEVNVSAN